MIFLMFNFNDHMKDWVRSPSYYDSCPNIYDTKLSPGDTKIYSLLMLIPKNQLLLGYPFTNRCEYWNTRWWILYIYIFYSKVIAIKRNQPSYQLDGIKNKKGVILLSFVIGCVTSNAVIIASDGRCCNLDGTVKTEHYNKQEKLTQTQLLAILDQQRHVNLL